MAISTKKNHLTKEGYENLVQELHELKNKKLPAVLERLAEAKAMGDLSENFEYKSALEDKDFIASRMSSIQELIENVEIISEKKTTKKGGSKFVDYGSIVTLKLEDDDEYEVTIVGSGEVEVDDEIKISLESPIGMAIKGKKAGEEVKIKLVGGRQTIKVIDVK